MQQKGKRRYISQNKTRLEPYLEKYRMEIVQRNIFVPVVGRRALQSLVCDNIEMLISPGDKYGEDIDVTNRLKNDFNEEESNGRITAIYGDSVFHSSGSVEYDGLTTKDIYVDFGDNEPRDIETQVSKRIAEAKCNRLSKERARKLSDMIEKHKSKFRLILESGGPARVTPMRIYLDDTREPVNVKVRKYPAEQ